MALPPEVPESSGVAPGVWADGEWPAEAPSPSSGDGAGAVTGGGGAIPDRRFFWTHNDSGWDPVLFAVAPDGSPLGQVRVRNARNVDWEDLAAAPCGDRRCLYIADTGDNLEQRDDPAIYRVTEPRPGDSVSAPAQRFPLRLPDGPRDIEAMAILPGEELLLISKGRSHPVEVYRSPGSLSDALDRAGGDAIAMEMVQRLSSSPVWLPHMVTGAAGSADGSLVAVRTYETLRFYRVEPDAREGPLVPLPGGLANLRPLREPQGEAVAFLPDGEAGEVRLVLTSEAGPGGSRGQMAVLGCRLF